MTLHATFVDAHRQDFYAEQDFQILKNLEGILNLVKKNDCLSPRDLAPQLYRAIREIRQDKLLKSTNSFVEHYIHNFTRFDDLVAAGKKIPEIIEIMASSSRDGKIKKRAARTSFFLANAKNATTLTGGYPLLRARLRRSILSTLIADTVYKIIEKEYHNRFSGNELPHIISAPVRNGWGKFWAHAIHGNPSSTPS